MKRWIAAVFLIVLFLIFAVFFLKFGKKEENSVCFEKECFYVELADAPKKQENGLMFRESLGENKGMLFIFENEGDYSFWMKNTKIPLDIIWIDKNGAVVYISKNNKQCADNFCPSIRSDKNANYVLEVNGGEADRIGLKIGDSAKINFKK